jgi:ketosteroid isomerase-like protein
VVEDAGGDRPTIVARNDAGEEANVKALYTAIGAIDQKDAGAYGALLADSVQLRSYGDGLMAEGKKAVLAAMKKRSSALLDVDHGIGLIWGADDWVVARVSATRTTRDRKVTPNQEVHFFRFRDGKIVEHHVIAHELHTAWRRDQVRREDLVPPAP